MAGEKAAGLCAGGHQQRPLLCEIKLYAQHLCPRWHAVERENLLALYFWRLSSHRLERLELEHDFCRYYRTGACWLWADGAFVVVSAKTQTHAQTDLAALGGAGPVETGHQQWC